MTMYGSEPLGHRDASGELHPQSRCVFLSCIKANQTGIAPVEQSASSHNGMLVEKAAPWHQAVGGPLHLSKGAR